MTITFTVGLPASGKSTWAKQFVQKNTDWIRVNRDELRNMRGQYWIPKQEGMITAWEDACIMEALKRGYNVIVDATNLKHAKNLGRYQTYKKIDPELVIDCKFFTDVSLEECIERDNNREESVGEDVIRRMYEQNKTIFE